MTELDLPEGLKRSVRECRDAATAERMCRGARGSSARMESVKEEEEVEEEEEGKGERRVSWFTAVVAFPLICCSTTLSDLSMAHSKSD